MKTLLLCGVMLGLFGCGPTAPPLREEQTRVWDIGVINLHRSYLDSSERWTGQRVRIKLDANDIRTRDNAIHWYSHRDTDPPCIVFQTSMLNVTGVVEIVGIVRGRIYDGQKRASGATWYVLIEQCEVRQLR